MWLHTFFIDTSYQYFEVFQLIPLWCHHFHLNIDFIFIADNFFHFWSIQRFYGDNILLKLIRSEWSVHENKEKSLKWIFLLFLCRSLLNTKNSVIWQLEMSNTTREIIVRKPNPQKYFTNFIILLSIIIIILSIPLLKEFLVKREEITMFWIMTKLELFGWLLEIYLFVEKPNISGWCGSILSSDKRFAEISVELSTWAD